MKKLIFTGLLTVLIIPSLAGAYFDSSLKLGSRGEAVVELQDFLQNQGFYTGKVDGKFGLGTLRSVKNWQTSVGLLADGSFGKGSRSKATFTKSNPVESNFAPLTAPVITNGVVPPESKVSTPPTLEDLTKITGLRTDFMNLLNISRGYGDLHELFNTPYDTLLVMLNGTDSSSAGQSNRNRINVVLKLQSLAQQIKALGGDVPEGF